MKKIMKYYAKRVMLIILSFLLSNLQAIAYSENEYYPQNDIDLLLEQYTDSKNDKIYYRMVNKAPLVGYAHEEGKETEEIRFNLSIGIDGIRFQIPSPRGDQNELKIAYLYIEANGKQYSIYAKDEIFLSRVARGDDDYIISESTLGADDQAKFKIVCHYESYDFWDYEGSYDYTYEVTYTFSINCPKQLIESMDQLPH